MNRGEIETVAKRYGVAHLDGLNDEAAARLILSKVPGMDPNGSPTYVEGAINMLVGRSGTERRDSAERVVRLDGAPGGEEDLVRLRGRAEGARARVQIDTEAAWQRPTLGASAPADKLSTTGTLADLAERVAAQRRAAAGVPGPEDAEAARRRMLERAENAWRQTPDIAAVAEELSARLRR